MECFVLILYCLINDYYRWYIWKSGLLWIGIILILCQGPLKLWGLALFAFQLLVGLGYVAFPWFSLWPPWYSSFPLYSVPVSSEISFPKKFHSWVNGYPSGFLQADVHNVKDAICSAVDVMQAMASSICLLTSKVSFSSLVPWLLDMVVSKLSLPL